MNAWTCFLILDFFCLVDEVEFSSLAVRHGETLALLSSVLVVMRIRIILTIEDERYSEDQRKVDSRDPR